MNARLVMLVSLWGSTLAVGQTGSLFDPSNAEVDSPVARPAAMDSPSHEQAVTKQDHTLKFPVRESNGPVMIKVASFAGRNHAIHANSLVDELRNKHGLEAYAFRFQTQVEDLASEEEAKAYEEKFKVKPRRFVPLSTPPVNWVVLVGNFESFEDPKAERTLTRVSKLEVFSVPKRIWNEKIDPEGKLETKDASGHVLSKVMLVRNPLLRGEVKKIDEETSKLLSELNTNTAFSIYQNPGAYTLVVAQFQGGAVFEDKKKGKLFSGKSMFKEEESPLANAARQAVSLADALQKLGWTPYVFHGQYASLVCIGDIPEKLDLKNPEFIDPRRRALVMSQDQDVMELRKKVATVTIGGIPLAPYAELIVVPRPPSANSLAPLAE